MNLNLNRYQVTSEELWYYKRAFDEIDEVYKTKWVFEKLVAMKRASNEICIGKSFIMFLL